MPKNRPNSRENSGKTREKLIDVAIDLFSRKGFKGTSIRDIAAKMGMTTSNIYHYFGTKGGVLSAIERQTSEPILNEFRRITSLDMPPLDRFTLLIRTHLTYMDTHRKESKIFTLSEETFPPDMRDLNKKFQKETFIIYRAEIERLLASMGRKGNSTIAAFNTFGVIVWFLRWYRPEGRNSLDEVINAIIDYVLYGIIGDRPPGEKKSKT
ncbi:TetR/AcrR family transcriptional regulator [Thermodesulfobacteriota bacterium]